MTSLVTSTVVAMARIEEPMIEAPIGSHSLKRTELYSMMPTPAGTNNKAKCARSTLTTGSVFSSRPLTVIKAKRKSTMPMTDPGTGAPVNAAISMPANWKDNNSAMVVSIDVCVCMWAEPAIVSLLTDVWK